MIGGPQLLAGYLEAKRFVVDAGFASDVDWSEALGRVVLTPTYVMAESAWVVVNSGFRYAVARKLWPALTAAFHGWDPNAIGGECRPSALQVLRYPAKIDAIIRIAALVRDCFDVIVEHREDLAYLRSLPFIGPVTCYHLAKLLGADVVKPDVHLSRAARAVDATPLELCQAIAAMTGDRVATVDTVFWRWAEQHQATDADWSRLLVREPLENKVAPRDNAPTVGANCAVCTRKTQGFCKTQGSETQGLP